MARCRSPWGLGQLVLVFLSSFGYAVWDDSLINTYEPEVVADNRPVFSGPNNTVQVLAVFDGGFFDYQVCKFAEHYVNGLGLGVTVQVLTRNVSMDLPGVAYQRMLLPYFQTDNNIGAVITNEAVMPTLAMWRIVLGADRILLTDCTDHILAEHEAVFPFMPESQWEIMTRFMVSLSYRTYAVIMDDSARAQGWATDWLKYSAQNGMSCKETTVLLTHAMEEGELRTSIYRKLLSVRQSGARIFITFLDNEVLDLLLNEILHTYPAFASPDYMWISAKHNVTIFGGSVPEISYEQYPEGVEYHAAWSKYAQAALSDPGAPTLASAGLSQHQWDYKAWSMYTKIRQYTQAMVKMLSQNQNANYTAANVNASARRDAETLTFTEYSPLIIAAMKSTPWISSNGMDIVRFNPQGIRTNLTRTITASMSNGEYLDNVASLVGITAFTVNTSGLVWNQLADHSPSWDAFCFNNFVYDLDGSGCSVCPPGTCAREDHLACVSCEQPFYDMGLLWYLYVAGGMALLSLTVMSVCLVSFWHRPELKSAVRPFVAVMLIGGYIAVLSTFTQQLYRSSLTCSTHRYIAFVGESVMFGAIMAKTLRLWRIFHNPTLKRTMSSLPEIAIFLCATGSMVSLYIAFLVAGAVNGTIGDMVPHFDDEDRFYVNLCYQTSAQHVIGIVAYALVIFLPLATVALGTMLKLLLDMRAKDKYRDFDELRSIMSGAVFFGSLVIVLLPAELISMWDPESHTRQAISLIFYLLFCLGSVILCGGIMVPKMYSIYLNTHSETTNASDNDGLTTSTVCGLIKNWLFAYRCIRRFDELLS